MDINNLITFKDGKKVLMDGPLSRIFTQALQDDYAKEIEETTGMVLESQVMQVMQQAKNYVEASRLNSNLADDDVGMLYAVDSNATIAQDLANISAAYSVMSNNQIRNSAVLVTDITEDPKQMNLNIALTAFCSYANIRVYNSLEEYMSKNKVV